jgi:hypothetical protein
MNSKLQKIFPFLLGLAVIGFLAPRFEILGLRLAYTDLFCLIILSMAIIGPTDYSIYRSGIRRVEISYIVILLVLGVYYGLAYSDPASLFIPLRLLVFCVAGATAVFINKQILNKTLKIITWIIIVAYIPDSVNALYSLISGKITLFDFMWNYDAGRLTAHYEGAEGTSSVPIGYLFSFIFLYNYSKYSENRSVKWFVLSLISITMCILTASRSSILSCITTIIIMQFGRKSKATIKERIIKIFLLLLMVYYLGDLLLSKSLIDGSLDGSSSQRLSYYTKAYDDFLSQPKIFLLGNGISDSLLFNQTGIAFYESLLFNSMAQGGFFLFISSLTLLISPLFYVYRFRNILLDCEKRSIISICLIVIVGNALGGANYFSFYAYLYYRLLLESNYLKINKVQAG